MITSAFQKVQSRGSQLEAISPQGHLGMSGDISVVTTGVATDKDADEHPTVHRSIMKRNYVAQNENSAEGRNPGFELISRVEELRLEAGDGLICNSGRAEAMLLIILHSSSKPAWDTMQRRSLYSGFLVAQMVKNLPETWETWVQFLSQEDPLEKRIITHSSIPTQRTPWTQEPGGPLSKGFQTVVHN